MSEMIERVARAISTECRLMGDSIGPGAATYAAKAAILAMREPTDSQENLMHELLGKQDRPPTKRWHWIWQEMIDAAVTDQTN